VPEAHRGRSDYAVTMNVHPPRHEMGGLVFTWPSEAQIDAYYAAIVGTNLFDTLLWDGPSHPQELHAFWADRRQDYAAGPRHVLSLAVIDPRTDVMIGSGSLRPVRPDHGVWDLGYALAPAFQGRGHGTTLVRLLVDIAFHERGAARLEAEVFVGNAASRRVLEKAGFVLEGTARSVIAKGERRLDAWRFGLVRQDWVGQVQLASHLTFLHHHAVDRLGHTDATLLAHLLGVRSLLLEWHVPADVVDAGLFHSIYGTESYRTQALALALRPEVRAQIGERAEHLAYLFGAMEKDTLYANLARPDVPFHLVDRFTGLHCPLSPAELSDLCVLTVANWLEQRPRAGLQHQRLRSEEFEQMLGFLPERPRAALVAAYGFSAPS
jgi:RimJ/RimL family protein N-acetyltransferase